MSVKDWNDQRIEIIIGSLLRAGVLLAARGSDRRRALSGAPRARNCQLHHLSRRTRSLKSIPAVVDGIAVA